MRVNVSTGYRKVMSRMTSTSASASASSSSSPAALKSSLLRLVSAPSPPARADVVALVAELEAINPTDNPATKNDLLTADWSLLWTGAASAEEDELRRSKEGVGAIVSPSARVADEDADKEKNPLGRSLSTIDVNDGAGKPFAKTVANQQNIDAFNGVVSNEASISLFWNAVVLHVIIKGRCSQSDARPDTRLDVVFDDVSFKLGRDKESAANLVTVPLQWANGGRGPEGWVEVTYLDDTLRLGRGDKGSVFVTARRPAGSSK
ncbi:PAP_fibrillin domain-containing protein [Pycnococcus provasolii]